MCALDPENENHVLAFKGVGVTILGRMTQPSSKGSNLKITRFSEEEANSFYHNKHNTANKLEEFAKERRATMAEKKSYKINKTELKEIDWGGVDKAAMRDKIMEAKNRDTLVKAVYALVEDGWEDAPSEHLKYPLMAEIDGTFYYVREALSSALAYAKQHNEQAVIDKVEKLYKKFDLEDSEGKEEGKGMAVVTEFSAVDIGNLWGKLWDALHAKYPDGEYGSVYRIDSIWEEDNKKFAIIYHKDEDDRYRLDFSLTEEGLELADEIIKVEVEIVETDVVRKFAEPENVEKYRATKLEEPKVDFEAECHKLEDKCQEQESLIMSLQEQIKELQEFKAQVEASQKALSVNEVLEKVKGHVDEDKYNEFATSAENYSFEELSAWKNIVFAYCGEQMIEKSNDTDEGQIEGFKMSLPTEETEPKSLWERM